MHTNLIIWPHFLIAWRILFIYKVCSLKKRLNKSFDWQYTVCHCNQNAYLYVRHSKEKVVNVSWKEIANQASHVASNSMARSVYLFYQDADTVSSPRGGFWGLSPLKQSSKTPKIKTWNTINQLSFCQFLEWQSSPHKAKAPHRNAKPPIENFLATVLRG